MGSMHAKTRAPLPDGFAAFLRISLLFVGAKEYKTLC